MWRVAVKILLMNFFPFFLCLSVAQAQFPPPVTDQTIHTVPGTNITIRYKEPGICETTPSIKSVRTY